MIYDIVIVGAGPAGMTAAIYAKRFGKTVLMIEKRAYGGQITYSPRVENYPGFESISGSELADNMFNQALNLGAELAVGNVTHIENSGKIKRIFSTSGEYECKAVIFATGADHRKLGVPNEDKLIGKGVSYCAVCDGMFFRNKDVAVIGGGNSALQEALYLKDICRKVYLVHRRDEYRADSTLVSRIDAADNIIQKKSYVVEKIIGENRVEGIELKCVNDNEMTEIALSGVFIAVGVTPQNSAYSGILETDNAGYADVGDDCTAKSGIYVAGDCRKKNIRQLTTAVCDGTVAAISACNYIDEVN